MGEGATPVDFASILDGTIQGRIDITISSGSLTFTYPFVVDAPGSYPMLWQTIDASSANGSGLWTKDFTVEIVTPEPSPFLLSLAGVFLLSAATIVRQKRRRLE